MIFASHSFLFFFLPLFLWVYYSVPFRYKSYVIAGGSYVFYGWWRPDFLLLFVAITVWNYYFGAKIAQFLVMNRALAFRWLAVGVSGNLAALGYFKYANFGVEVIVSALQPLGLNTFTLEHIILPLGISFYIFQAISYIVDIYREQAQPARRFVDFAAFVALFPQLIAGPILRYRALSEQLNERQHSLSLFSLGACRFMLGFTKKVLIADSIAPLTEALLANPAPQLVDAWLGALASLVQLYFDFSGYSDMAIGLGMMMGFRFAENFNQPFLAMSLTEFWRRWHLTLADFLKDYVFKPLNQGLGLSINLSLFITMLLSGLWHGASFAFIFFGAYFGIFMVLERNYGLTTHPRSPYKLSRNLITLLLILFCMTLFVTGDLRHALVIYEGQLGFRGIGSLDYYRYEVTLFPLLFLGVALIWLLGAGYINLSYYADFKRHYFMWQVAGRHSVLLWAGFLLALTKLAASSYAPFLYFQF